MIDPAKIKLNANLQPLDSIVTQDRGFISALQQDQFDEPNPFGNPTTVINGNLRVLGTLNLDPNTGTVGLTTNGDFDLQTRSGSAVLVARVGGTNFFFNSGGTF